MNTNDTIAALCTPPGGAICVLRISGGEALKAGNTVWKGSCLLSERTARVLSYGRFTPDGGASGDPALAVFMPAPNSYTGEDVVEIHCHGGGLVSRALLQNVLKTGVRMAEPGEFTFRAFINGKMDLTQAEAVGEIISAQSEMALKLAENQMAGMLGTAIRKVREILLDVLSEIESRLDFCEEELDWKAPEQLAGNVSEACSRISRLLKSRTQGSILRNGVKLVIAGRPNSGKSSLLNCLLGFDRAIVTDMPGTTRDTLEENVVIRGIPVKIIDTAGIRQADNIVEGMGIQRSLASLGMAQLVVWLMDASSDDLERECSTLAEHAGGRPGLLPVWNKCDLVDNKAHLPPVTLPSGKKLHAVRASTLSGEGLETIIDRIEDLVWQGQQHDGDPETAVSERHANLLENSLLHLDHTADDILQGRLEIASVDIRASIFSLGTITGEDADPDVLEDIFSRFCIGK